MLCFNGSERLLGYPLNSKKEIDVTPIKRSFYGQVRSTAYNLWRGPIRVRNQTRPNFLGGHCVLRLALRQGTSGDPRIEARAAYASFTDEPPSDAIVRAMFWESNSVVRRNRDDPPVNTPFTIPAKFVRVPIEHVRHWVKRFDGLETSLQLVPQEDDGLPICSLRIETDYVYNAFEKVWQVRAGEQSELLHAWLHVWHEMGTALTSGPALTDLQETFPRVDGQPDVYDFQAYEPLLTLP